MRHLRREIHIRQAMVVEDRQLLAAHASMLRQRTLQTLATPKGLLASFGVGFAAALLRGRHKDEHESEEPAASRHPWLPLLLRDVAMPLAMQMLQARQGGAEPPDQY